MPLCDRASYGSVWKFVDFISRRALVSFAASDRISARIAWQRATLSSGRDESCQAVERLLPQMQLLSFSVSAPKEKGAAYSDRMKRILQDQAAAAAS